MPNAVWQTPKAPITAHVEYALALRNVHYEKGTILDDYGICLAEGPWPDKAYRDAAELNRSRGHPRPLNYASQNPIIVSQGQAAVPPGQSSCALGTTAGSAPQPHDGTSAATACRNRDARPDHSVIITICLQRSLAAGTANEPK